jgi:hypothetical protein
LKLPAHTGIGQLAVIHSLMSNPNVPAPVTGRIRRIVKNIEYLLISLPFKIQSPSFWPSSIKAKKVFWNYEQLKKE